MAILSVDYNPNEVAMYLRKKNPKAQIQYEKVGDKDVIYCDLQPENLILPRGWKLVSPNILTNYKKGKENVYSIYIF